MAVRSRTPGTPEYRRRQARIAARRSEKPVGAALDPETMLGYINEYYEEQGKRAEIANTLQDVDIQDPLKRQEIRETAQRSIGQRGQELAERGLSARGIRAGDVSDIERSRVMQEQAHELQNRTIRARATAALAELNNRRTALDKNYAAIAGRSIKAGTGIYKNRRPAGWTPPSLPSTQQPGAPSPSAPATVGSGPQRPTGARLPTTGTAINYARSLVKNAPKIAAGRKRVRVA